MFFMSVHQMIPKRQLFFQLLEKVVLLDAFEAFLLNSTFNKTIFYLGEKQGLLVRDECSSWCNRVGNFWL